MFIEVNKNLLNTVSFGKGRRTLLTHGGWAGNWEVWQQVFELMSGSWRCVGYDHRGGGTCTYDDPTARGGGYHRSPLPFMGIIKPGRA